MNFMLMLIILVILAPLFLLFILTLIAVYYAVNFAFNWLLNAAADLVHYLLTLTKDAE